MANSFSLDDFANAAGAKPTPVVTPSVPPGAFTMQDFHAASAPPIDTSTGIGNMTQGLLQAGHDVLDWPAEHLAALAAKAHLISPQSAAKVASNDQLAKDQYAATSANHPSAKIGRVLGDVGASIPLVEGAGGLIGKGVGALADAAPEGIGNALTKVSRFVSGNAGNSGSVGGLLTKGLSNAAHGATVGAAANALTGGSGGYSGENLKTGAALGALAGGAAPIVGRVAGDLAGRAGRIFETEPSAQNSALQDVLKALERDGLTPEAALQRVRALGPHGVMADLGGNVQRLGEAVASVPGRGASMAENVLEGRAAEQPGRLAGAVQKATGATSNFHDLADALMENRAREAAPLYEKAFNVGAITSDRAKQFLADPIMKSGLAKGLEIQRLEALKNGTPFDPKSYGMSVTPEGEMQLTGVPNMRTLDAAKRGLDDILEGYRDKTTGKMVLDQRGRAIQGVKSAYVDELDRMNPDYATARAAYAGPSQSLDAMHLGRRALNNDPEVTSKVVAKLSPGDKQFFQAGLQRALLDKIDSTQEGANAVRKIFGNPAMRKKLAAGFANPQAFEQFAQTMENEGIMADTRNQVLKGSQTARRLSAQGDMGSPGTHLLNAARGRFLDAAHGATMDAINALSKPSETRSNALGQILFGDPGESMSRLNSAPLSRSQAVANKLIGTGRKTVVPGLVLGTDRR